MHVFDRAVTLEVSQDEGPRSGRFDAELDRELWVADTGPWGGYLAALLTAAISQRVPELPLVSLTVHFLRRLEPGAAQVAVEVESLGARVGHTSARIVQNGRAGAIAVATLGRNPQPDHVSDFERPDAPPPTEVPRRAESSHA